MRMVATTSLPAVDGPNADHWNAACSCQNESSVDFPGSVLFCLNFQQSLSLSMVRGQSNIGFKRSISFLFLQGQVPPYPLLMRVYVQYDRKENSILCRVWHYSPYSCSCFYVFISDVSPSDKKKITDFISIFRYLVSHHNRIISSQFYKYITITV